MLVLHILLQLCRSHIGIQMPHDPDRAADNEDHEPNRKHERDHPPSLAGPETEMQKEHHLDDELEHRKREDGGEQNRMRYRLMPGIDVNIDDDIRREGRRDREDKTGDLGSKRSLFFHRSDADTH